MASKIDYRRLFSLLLQPTGPVYVLDIRGRRWVTDRFVMFDAALAGVDAAVRDLPEGAYAVLATKPPVPHDVELKDAERLAEGLARKLDQLAHDGPHYRPVKPTPWSLDGPTGSVNRLLLRETDDGPRGVFVNRDLIDSWWHRFFTTDGSTETAFEQAFDKDPIRVRRRRSVGQINPVTRQWERYWFEDIVGYLMPVRVEAPAFPIDALEQKGAA